jgi:hypothetical protein
MYPGNQKNNPAGTPRKQAADPGGIPENEGGPSLQKAPEKMVFHTATTLQKSPFPKKSPKRVLLMRKG